MLSTFSVEVFFFQFKKGGRKNLCCARASVWPVGPQNGGRRAHSSVGRPRAGPRPRAGAGGEPTDMSERMRMMKIPVFEVDFTGKLRKLRISDNNLYTGSKFKILQVFSVEKHKSKKNMKLIVESTVLCCSGLPTLNFWFP
jgi:hypothetical protein